MSDTINRRLIPDPKVARERYGRHLRTLARWDDKPELGFPGRQKSPGETTVMPTSLSVGIGRTVSAPLRPSRRKTTA